CLVDIQPEIMDCLVFFHGSRPFLSFGFWRFQTYRKGRAFNMRHPETAAAAERAQRASAAEDGEGSPDALLGAEAQTGFVVDLPYEKPQFRSCPRRCHWRSFAVLRRISLAALAQRLRQSQDDRLLVKAVLYNLSR
ncbi:MAG TPA: hypothetical protein VLC46_03520, partial [Thermoanaerobaculia bacterium]|nr:hypothetical protein [Thermoanaerobaculia bacterium]